MGSGLRVVVTGGAGFIGANLCRRLVERDHQVVAFDDLSTGRRENLVSVPDVPLVEGTVLDGGALVDAFGGADAVVHLAARPSVPRSIADPVASHATNATGTVNVLEAARLTTRPHVIVASSSSVYGSNPLLPKNEGLVPMPLSPYAATKLATEAYALAWSHSFGLDVLAFRFFNVFGPLQTADHAYAAVIPAFVSAALAGRPLPVHGDGGQTRDFTYVDSVTDVIAVALERRLTHMQPVNLAFGGRASLLEVITTLEGILGRVLERDHQPPRPGDVRDSQADQASLRALVPDVEPVPFELGLRRTVEWFESVQAATAAHE